MRTKYQTEIQPNYFQGSLKGLTGGKREWFSPLPFILSFTIPFKILEACWEEHPVSSYLLTSSRWNKSDTVFSDWVCLGHWPLLYFYSRTGSERFQSTLKEPAPVYVYLYWSTCQPVQWFRFSVIPSLGMASAVKFVHFLWPALLQSDSLMCKAVLTWYCKDLSISDLWLTLCLYAISHKET